jgi:hypothetical protein
MKEGDRPLGEVYRNRLQNPLNLPAQAVEADTGNAY